MDLIPLMRAELEKGWIQGDLENEHGVCMMGALLIADHGEARDLVRTADGHDAFRRLLRITGTEWLAQYNDHPFRTKAEVLAVCDKAAIDPSHSFGLSAI